MKILDNQRIMAKLNDLIANFTFKDLKMITLMSKTVDKEFWSIGNFESISKIIDSSVRFSLFGGQKFISTKKSSCLNETKNGKEIFLR